MSVIMSINTTILCITFMSFVVFGTIQTAAADYFNINQFLGVWYVVGIISPASNNLTDVSCYQLNITKEEGRQQNFKKESSMLVNGIRVRDEGYGKIVDSVVTVLFPFETEKTMHNVNIYNNGEELIFHNSESPPSHELLSRYRTVNEESVEKFEKLAKESNIEAVFILNPDCQ